MGRYVYPLRRPKGYEEIPFKWKFAFGEQPSDFGEVLADLTSHVERYTNDFTGEIVVVSGYADKIANDIRKNMKDLDYSLGQWEAQMIEKFLKVLDSIGHKKVWELFYVEY